MNTIVRDLAAAGRSPSLSPSTTGCGAGCTRSPLRPTRPAEGGPIASLSSHLRGLPRPHSEPASPSAPAPVARRCTPAAPDRPTRRHCPSGRTGSPRGTSGRRRSPAPPAAHAALQPAGPSRHPPRGVRGGGPSAAVHRRRSPQRIAPPCRGRAVPGRQRLQVQVHLDGVPLIGADPTRPGRSCSAESGIQGREAHAGGTTGRS